MCDNLSINDITPQDIKMGHERVEISDGDRPPIAIPTPLDGWNRCSLSDYKNGWPKESELVIAVPCDGKPFIGFWWWEDNLDEWGYGVKWREWYIADTHLSEWSGGYDIIDGDVQYHWRYVDWIPAPKELTMLMDKYRDVARTRKSQNS